MKWLAEEAGLGLNLWQCLERRGADSAKLSRSLFLEIPRYSCNRN
ncbi:hypothetical protein APTSU1_000189100 [Apodemus speciosus]|uniref:Uncharacterized protein n=1 Tax=Apodemus speciosus TaxID=105296 RepID=A0ABQ0EIR0_APOSI